MWDTEDSVRRVAGARPISAPISGCSEVMQPTTWGFPDNNRSLRQRPASTSGADESAASLPHVKALACGTSLRGGAVLSVGRTVAGGAE